MSKSYIPTEVELAYELMPCQAMHVAEQPGPTPHPCSYFRKWGTYHSYADDSDKPPAEPRSLQPAQYLGRGPLAPEMLSGCRKAPIMALGINPNLPGWWPATINSVSPLFDTVAQYASYFRYRETAKLDIPLKKYRQYLGGRKDGPFSHVELTVPANADGLRALPVELQAVQMYLNYQSLLADVAKAMGWSGHKLTVGEDVSYGNMVACASAKWINRRDPSDPKMPPMSSAEQTGIVAECFHHRRYFLRQLFQSLPRILMIFSQSTTDAFLGEMQGRFSKGSPKPGDKIEDLLNREIRLRFGSDAKGKPLEARVIFAPHITGDPKRFAKARSKVLAQLVAEAKAGRVQYNSDTGHLRRPEGACVFCTMMQIGDCDYETELVPLSNAPTLTADSEASALLAEKQGQAAMLAAFLQEPQRRDGSPSQQAVTVGSRSRNAVAGWQLAGDPKRQRDREPIERSKAARIGRSTSSKRRP